MKIWFSC